jgi:hypothetical protein
LESIPLPDRPGKRCRFKPKTLNELSEYELQNLVSYLAGEWDGSGPHPGYSWRESFSDADLGEVPPSFNEWLQNFELEYLISIEDGRAYPMSLCLLKDKARAEVAIFIYTSSEPAERIGQTSYGMGSFSTDLLWPIVEDYLDREEILPMNFQVHDPDLIPRDKVRAFLEEKLTAHALTLRLRIPSP